MALYRVYRHAQGSRNFRRIKILLISQQDHGARRFRQPSDKLTQAALQQRILIAPVAHEEQTFFHRDRFVPWLLAKPIDCTIDGHPAQPERQMRSGFN
jgi:hypothetical protein